MIRCLLCRELSLSVICNNCQINFLKPSFYKRVLPCGFKVYSFYKYRDIAPLIKSKHRFIGSQIYNILAKNSFYKFSQNFTYKNIVLSISLDDKVESGYSHTAILNKALKSPIIRPVYSKLRSRNNISYSGKSLDYRLKNHRDFNLNLDTRNDLIIVDDIITTGTTIIEAKNVIHSANQSLLFALCLADAKEF